MLTLYIKKSNSEALLFQVNLPVLKHIIDKYRYDQRY